MNSNSFFTTIHCRSRKHCVACRGDAAFRCAIAGQHGLSVDFPCPFGVTALALRAGPPPAVSAAAAPGPAPTGAGWRGLGDVVAAATKAVGIKPCGGCKKRQAKLNALVPFGPGAGGAEPAKMTDSKV